MSFEKNNEARAIMANAQMDEFKHFGMDLEFLLRRKADWRVSLQGILFKDDDIVEHGEQAEKKTDGRRRNVEEKWEAPRKRVLKAGSISFGGAAISCMVRNINATGALLEVESPLGIPERFILMVPSDQLSRPCRTIWKSEHRLGVRFERPRDAGAASLGKARGCLD